MKSYSFEARQKLPENKFGDPKRRLFLIEDQEDLNKAATRIRRTEGVKELALRLIAIGIKEGLSIPQSLVELTLEQETKVENPDAKTETGETATNAKTKTEEVKQYSNETQNEEVTANSASDSNGTGTVENDSKSNYKSTLAEDLLNVVVRYDEGRQALLKGFGLNTSSQST